MIDVLWLVTRSRLRDGECAQLRDIRVLIGRVLVAEPVNDGDEERLRELSAKVDACKQAQHPRDGMP